MKIRIISDLHIGINEPISYGDDIFTIVVGDISSDYKKTVSWVSNNIKKGLFIEGNHIGYGSEYTINELQKMYKNEFPTNNNVSYLYDDYKIIDDYIFVGGILWTDYLLNGYEKIDNEKMKSLYYMNDFRFNYYKKNKKLTPDDCIKMHNKTKNVILKICKKYPNKKIIVITHHAPSILSVSEKYKGSSINSSFASNLESIIKENDNIKLWVHGHMHNNSDYNIGNCRIICNPHGYKNENKDFNKNLIIDI